MAVVTSTHCRFEGYGALCGRQVSSIRDGIRLRAVRAAATGESAARPDPDDSRPSANRGTARQPSGRTSPVAVEQGHLRIPLSGISAGTDGG
jgi:hypothetical protein